MRSLLLVIVALVGLGMHAAMAQTNPPTSGPPGAEGGRPPGPPPEAFSACSGKAQGTACTMIAPRGETMTGTCEAGPGQRGGPGASSDNGQLACRPDRMPPGKPDEKR